MEGDYAGGGIFRLKPFEPTKALSQQVSYASKHQPV